MDLFSDLPLTLADADLRWQPGWLDQATADHWLATLLTEVPWQQPEVFVHGRQHPVPRLLAWYGDSDARYGYAGLSHQPLPWTPLLAEIRARVQAEAGQRLNGVLLNYYRDGQD